MFGFGKKTCGFCGSQVPGRDAFRAPDRSGAFVCSTCHEMWDRGGRTCVQCQTRVQGAQEIGAFFDRRALGHADCGGLKLFH